MLSLVAGVARTTSAPDRYQAAHSDGFDVTLEQQSGLPLTSEVARLPAVAEVRLATFVFGGLFEVGSDAPVDALTFAGDPRAIAGSIATGRLPSSAGEFVATASWARAAGAEIGDRFVLRTISQGQADERGFDVVEPDGPTLDATFVGLLGAPGGGQDAEPLAIFPERLLGVGDIGVSASVGLVDLAEGATTSDLRAQLDERLPDAVIGLEPAEFVSAGLRDAVGTQAQGLAIVTLIVGSAAIVLLGQLLARLARPTPGEQQTLRALGFRRRQVLDSATAGVAVPIALGAVLAAAGAWLGSAAFPLGFAERLEPDPGPRIEVVASLLGPLVLFVVLVAWVRGTLAVPPRSTGPTRPGLAERATKAMRVNPAVAGVRFALGPPAREVGRARAPIPALVGVATVMIAALVFGASLARFVDHPPNHGSGHDLLVGAGGDAIPDELRSLVEQDPDVDAATLYGTFVASVGADALDVTGMEPVRGTLAPDVLRGELPDTDDEVALGRASARSLGVGIGDELTISGEDGPVPYRVVGLVVVPAVEGGDGVGEGAITTLEGLRGLQPDARLGELAIRTRPGGAEGLAGRIRAVAGFAAGRPDDPPTVREVARVRSMPLVVAASLAALLVLAGGHHLLTSTGRRRRELATLQALGADRGWLRAALHWQGTATTLAVLLLALPLGIAAGRVTFLVYIGRIGGRPEVTVPAGTLAVAALALLVLSNVAAVLPAHRLRRSQPASALIPE